MSEQTEKDKLETLQQTVKFFDNLLASLIDGVVITDESHNIIVVNDAFCNLLGRRRQEVIETNLFLWLDLLNAGIPPLWTEMTRRLYHEGSCRDVEFQVTTTQGMKYLSVNASLLKSDITGKVCLISIWRDITERKISEERYKTIIHTSMDGFWLMDREGHILDVNDACCRLTGYTRDELLTMHVQDMEATERPEETARHIKKITEKGYDYFETRHRCKDGRIVDIEVSVTYHAMADGQFFAFIRDITDRKRREAEKEKFIHGLGERIKELKTLYNTSRILQEENKTLVEQVQAITNILPAGWQYPDVTVARIWCNGMEFMSPGFSESRWVQRVNITIGEGKQLVLEVFYLQEMPNEAEGPFLAEERQLINTIAEILKSHINRRQNEDTLRESEERYRLVTELTSDFIFKSIVSPGGQMVLEFITQRFADITGYSPDDIKTADSWQRIAHADDRQVLDGFFKAILKGQPNEGKLRIITKSGELKWIRVFVRPLRDEHKQRVVGILGAGKDITEYVGAEEERKRLSKELVEKERFLEAVLRQMPVGIIVAETPSGRLYLSNRKVTEILRHPFYPSAAVEQYVQYKGFRPDGRPYKPEEWPLARSVKTGEVVEGEEIDYLRGDGSHCWIKVYSGPIRDEKGQITGAIVSFFDVTERKQALERVEKLNTFLISLRKINEALVRSKDEVALFHVICDSLTGVGFVRFTWIGLFEEGSNDIKPIAHAGFEDGFLSSVTLRWDDAGYAASPAGIAVKTGKPYILIDIAKDQMNEAWRKEALKRGYKACVALPLKYDEKSIGVFVVFSGTKEAIFEEEILYLQEVATDISVGIKSRRLERGLQQSYERIRKTLKGTIDAIANICEKRDPYTSGHERRVAQLACAIAGEMGLSEDQVEGIRVTSCLHDIGKMEVPAEILSKPTKLSEIEFSLIKAHAQTGYEILKGVEFPWPVAQIILQHQERLDGSGYPNGLKGKEIMLEARILAVADTVEAMSSHRPYRPAMGIDMALKEITRGKGILYDPAVVDACLKLFRRKGFRFR